MRKTISTLALAASIGSVQADYQEVDGLVVIEAENTSSELGEWTLKTDVSGFAGNGYLEFEGNRYLNGPANSPLEYTFQVAQSGIYQLHMHVARETIELDGKIREDLANDCYVRVEGNFGAGPNPGDTHNDDAPLTLLKMDTKFFGGDDRNFVWAPTDENPGHLDPGGHKNKRVARYAFEAGETYKLVVSGRSKAFKLDRIVFALDDIEKASIRALSNPQTIGGTLHFTYYAREHFPILDAGEVPLYKDNLFDALAINAKHPELRNKFARAERTFDGPAGSYSITFTTITEEDGECTYQLHRNGEIVKTYVNPHIGHGAERDLQPHVHEWGEIDLETGDTIAISSITHTNGEIPEGDGTAWARGRWRQLELTLLQP